MRNPIYLVVHFSIFTIINIGFAQSNILTIAQGVSCKVPINWIVAGQDAIDMMNEMKRKAGIEKSSLKYVLYSEDITDETGYPFIQIGYENLDFDGAEVLGFDNAVNQLQLDIQNKVLPSAEIKFGEYFDKISVNSYLVDKSRRMVVFKIQTGIPNIGQIVSYNCFIYCKRGIARVGLNALINTEAKALPAFNIVIKTFSYN